MEFDKSNRKKWTGKPAIPEFKAFDKNIEDVLKQIEAMGIKTIGRIDQEKFPWPTSRKECIEVLDYFCTNLLVHFGDYEDALHTDEKFLFHSRLSFAMNSKMLTPKEVIETTLDYYYDHKDEIDISQNRRVYKTNSWMERVYERSVLERNARV